jgi:MFS family permease
MELTDRLSPTGHLRGLSTGSRSFAPLAVPNFRRYVAGQTLSLIGNWTETVAQALLVLQLTGSGFLLGAAVAARYLPVLLLTPFAGVLADRHDKRRLLLVTQSGLAMVSLIFGILVLTGGIDLGLVFTLAIAFGCLTAVDNPTRLAFVPEMVGRDVVRGAITINSTLVNVGRAVGPLVAAGLVAAVGIGWCFLVNAASFVAVVAALLAMDRDALHPSKPIATRGGELRDALRYARGVPEIIAPIAMMALIGTLTYEFEVSLPLFARSGVDAGLDAYAWLIGAFGFGAVLGGIYCTVRQRVGPRRLIGAAVAYGVSLAATALAPSLASAIVLLLVVGFANIAFLTTGNSMIQLASTPERRGRVAALWSTAFVGSTPVGALIIGAIGDQDPRAALLLGAVACLAAGAIGSHLLGGKAVN